MSRIFWLLLIAGYSNVWLFGQEFESVARTTEAPKEAFFESSPLAEVAFDGRRFDTKQDRIREHFLETPLGPAPLVDRPEIEPQPAPTPMRGLAEAGLGLAIRQNHALSDTETNNATSTVCEPSIAVRGQEVLFTGNWFAAFSRNGGTTFAYRNPETMFPSIPGRAFCCDQVAIYVPSHDLMVWFLQHGKDATGNTVRVAVAAGADIPAERWRFYDFTPQNIGNWSNEWFDYPDISYSNQHLFITTNGFTLSDSFARCVCLRIPLSELASYGALNYHYFSRTDIGSLRPTQGAQNRMFIGAHASTASLRVYSWNDASTSLQEKSFAVQPWTRGGAAAPGPDGKDWLGRVDGRITSAWRDGANPGFAWTSAQQASYPYPHVRVAVVDFDGGTVLKQPHIWNQDFAFAYPAAGTNATGNVGMGLHYGGNALYPSAAVGVWNDPSWALTSVATGSHGPDQNRWGDYQTVRINGQSRNRFAAAVFSLSGGSSRQSVVPRLVQFDVIATNSETPPSRVPREIAQDGAKPREVAKLASVLKDEEPKVQETGLKLSKELRQKNEAARDRAIATIRALADDSVRTTPTTNAVIPVAAYDSLDKYSALLKLPDIGEFFFEVPESVCSPDEREQVTDTTSGPWNGNCQLIITMNDGSRARGTGWLLNGTTVVTAGHCVHEGAGGGYYTSIEVIPGMNGPLSPFGSKTALGANLRASRGWTESGAVIDDYGVILLDSAFTGVSTTRPAALSDLELTGIDLELSGYPADKAAGTQWKHIGPASRLETRRLHYLIDTFGGHSGSAVTASTPSGRVAVGIHNYGGCPNKASRITTQMIEQFDAWIAGR